MNFRDALLADQGADRLSVETDRRLRRRLGFDAPTSTRRVWLRPAMAAFAVAAVALVVILYPAKQSHESPQSVATGFQEIDVPANSPASATVPWGNATVVAAPGTRLTARSASTLSLAHGAITVQRKDATPMVVDVPMGRVVIAAYRSTVTADRESVTITINDGTGHYDDADGQSHPLVPNAPLVWPPPTVDRQPDIVPDASTPAPSRKPANGRSSVVPAPVSPPIQEAPPGETKPSVPHRPDAPCTFKSDCDEGQTCRKNERGESVCMGNGAEDAACWFDNDCISQHCVQRRCVIAP